MLLLHGMMGGAWQFQWLQPALASAGYRSLAINYRGHHDSSPTRDLARVRVQDYLRDALAACANLRQRPIAVGQSMGGLIALLLAERDAVAGAAITCALPPAGIRWRGANDLRTLAAHLPATLLRRALLPDRDELDDLIFNRIPPEERGSFFARQVPESSTAAAQIALGAIRVSPRRVTCPVLSISAAEDRLVLPSVGAAIARRYRADHIELEQAGHHAVVGEPGWQTAAAALVSWMDAAVP